MKSFFILMADVIKSRNSDSKKVADNLKLLTTSVNRTFRHEILSPLTITLGDEFQTIITSRKAGIKIMIGFEELIIDSQIDIKLRYVLAKGKIDTPINNKIAHGMLGEGLTRTRESLNALKKEEERFLLSTGASDQIMNKYFILYQSIVDDWKPKDYKIVSDFLKLEDYKIVADENKKNWSQMWKRKKTLKIKEYNVIRQLILNEDE